MNRRLVVLAMASSGLLNAAKYVTTQPAEVVTILRPTSANTALLFAFATNQSGFDTEITLSNTSQDVFESTPGSGACTLYFYGSGAPASNPQTSNVIPAGQQIVFDISTGGGGIAAAPGFSGYIAANCAFPLARGLAKIFPLVTANGPAYSQDAQVLTLPRSTSSPQYLLFPYVTNQAGYDSGIIISNTSMDPFGSSPSSGGCTLNFYGANAPAPLSTGSIPAGSQYLTVASVVAANFQGYVIASCTFPGAAGSAFVSDVGARNVMYAANPELLTLPRTTTPNGLIFPYASNQSGYDTQIAIANTSLDPAGTTPGSGTCTLSFYGQNSPGDFTTPSIAAGSVYASTISQIAPGFFGYFTATCSFPQARGLALVGFNGFRTSYNSLPAEVVNPPRSTTTTGLLFPAVSNANGNDTSIVITNTSGDFANINQTGGCSISYFGTVGAGGPPSPQVSVSIPSHYQLSFSLSQGNPAQGIAATPGFSGYLAVSCGFPLARGFAGVIQSGPVLSIAKSHSGNFTQGQAGAYTVTVSNQAGAETTSGTVTVTETVPAGMTLTSMSGTGWTCPTGGATCTRSDGLVGGASYPITVNVNVAVSAASPLVNSVAVSGGLSPTASTTDSTTVNPAPAGSVTEYPVPTPSSNLLGIAAGPDGAMWFCEDVAGKVGRITTAGSITEYPIPTATGGCWIITAGPDGNLWFAEENGGKIGKVTTTGAFMEYALANSSSQPTGITAGPDGALWFTELGDNQIGRITTTGSVTEYPVPTPGGGPVRIAPGPDGALWFTEKTVGKIGRIAISGSFAEYPIPTASSGPTGIVAGPDGALWFTEKAGKIGRITTAGSFTEYRIPSGSPSAEIAVGPDSALWFTETTGNNIGRITTGGSITEYAVPTSGGYPAGLAAGPDGGIWFTEEMGNKIGRIASGLIAAPSLTIVMSDSGNFVQGQIGATYTLTVSNAAGAGSTSGTVTVMENLPAGLGLVSMAGTGWSCTGNSCNRSDSRAGGASYPAITVTVDVAGSASSPQVDSATVFGGGSSLAVAADSTMIGTEAVGGITEYPVPTANSSPLDISPGPDGALWFTEQDGNKIGRITTSGVFTAEYPVPTTAPSNLYGITTGPDGALWFAEGGAGKIGRITTSGSITEYPLADNTSHPVGIASAIDGALWFTETAGNQIGIFNPSGSGAMGSYALPTFGSAPNFIAVGPDGALWFTEISGNKIGRINVSGNLTEFALPTANSGPSGIAAGPDGALWFAEAGTSKIGRITTGGSIAEYNIPTANSGPHGIAAGADGALWFAETSTNKIGRITTAGVFTNEYNVPTNGGAPDRITAGPDGGIWFTEVNGNKIGRIATGINAAPALSITSNHSGNFTQGQVGATYTLAVSNAASAGATIGTVTVLENLSQALGLVSMSGSGWTCTGNTCSTSASILAGASFPPITARVDVAGNAGSTQVNKATVYGGGSSLAFAADSTAIIPQTTGGFSEYPVPTGGAILHGITLGPDGALWFAEEAGNKIGRITTTGIVSEFLVPTSGAAVEDLTTGPDGAIWFGETGAGKIGRIAAQGTFSEFPAPTPGLGPFGIVTGPDGNLWFVESAQTGVSKIGRMSTSGSAVDFPIPTSGAFATQIAVGPDGALWFTEAMGNKIGRITTAGTITEFPTAANSNPWNIVAGPDGALWFTEAGTAKMGRITTGGTITEFPIPSGNQPLNIGMGSDGAIWFTEPSGNQVGRVTTAGGFTEYPIPTSGSHPESIVAGSDSGMWFTEGQGNKIGRVSTGLTGTPALSISSTHSGNFTPGQQGTYTLTVSNAGTGGTNGTVFVQENLPAGLTVASMQGSGWACTLGVCNRNDSLGAAGAPYPPITVTVNVSAGAASPLVNIVTVYGGGSSLAGAIDSTVVNSTSLSIVCTPSVLSFTYTIGGTQPASESCAITSSPSGVSLTAVASTGSGQAWLSAALNSGTTPATLLVSVNTQSLGAEQYSGTVTLSAGGQPTPLPVTLTIISPVSFQLTPISASAPAAVSPGSASLTVVPTGSNTAWTAASTATWLHIVSPANGAGSGAATILYSVDANAGGERIGTFSVLSGGDVVAAFTVDQAAASCSALTVSPTSFTFGSGGGTGILTFDTAGCPWTASASDTSLITGLPTGGSTGTITFGVAAGPTAKSATITIGTTPPTTVTVTRNAPVCTYTIATHGAIGVSQSFIAPGGTGSVDVTAPAGCAWTASANSAFLSLTSGASGSGPGSVTYSVASNPSTTASRTGTLTVAGSAYTINQIPLGPQTYNCTTSTGVPPVVRGEGIAELTGDLLVTCSGFSSGGVTGDVLVTLNTSLTNHTLTADPSGQTTDALLLMDEPSSASLKLSGAGQNVYRGSVAGPLAVRFTNVSLAPEAGSFSHVFRITNVRADVSRAALPGPVTAAVAILSAAPFGSLNPQTVGLATVGSSGFAVGTPVPAPAGESLPVTFGETFPTAYRTRLASGQDPSAVGVVYNSESGYVNSAVLGSDTGFAANGTRLVVRLANIPSGTLVYAPVAQASGSATAVLVSADSNGVGGSPMQGSAQVAGYQPVALVNGAGTATWEITASNLSALDTVAFNLLFSNPSLTLQNSCAAGSVPSICGALGPQAAVGAPSNTAPVPRFVNPSVVAPAQVTRLNIAPNPAGGQSGSTTAKKSQAALARPRASAAIPQTSGSSNVVSVGGTVTIGEILQSDVNSPAVNGACVGTTLPPSYTITACSADNGGTCTPTGGNSISTCYPSFDPGQSSNINVTADTTDTSDAPAELDSNATSNFGNFGAGSFSQILSVSPGASITLSFQGPSGIPAGQTIAYTVSLNNRGAAKLAGDPMIVTIALDPSLTGVVAPVPGVGDAAWACKQTGVTLVCTNTSAVAANGQSSFEVSGASAAVGNIVSTSATLTLGGQVSAPQPVNTSIGPGAPATPTLLSPANAATGVSASASLMWSASSGAASYDGYLGASSPPPLVFNTTSLTYSPPAALANVTYYWQIVAKNSSASTPSAIWSFTVGGLTGYRFVPVTPCRIMDTRGATGTFGGPSIAGGATRSVPVPQSSCNIPSNAQAYSLNITVVPPGPLNYLSIWPTGQSQPVVSTLNSLDGRIVANAAIVPAGTNGAISLFVSNTTDVIIDINGYFAPASTAGSMSFYTATPCRIVDTRSANGAFGGPFLSGGSTRSFTIPSSSCGIPATAQAYSLNMTVVPHGALGYLTTWPTGQSQPLVSTLNSADGSIVANAAIVPAGTSGAVSVFVTNDTDVIIDINGYFAPPGSTGALSLYTLTPCRIADTRGTTGAFGGPSLAGNSTRSFAIPSSACSVPSTAQAYSLNVTVVPPGTLNYLTAWPTGRTQPVVSTLNSLAGKVVANAAIVPAGTGGGVSLFVSNTTDVILDINAYFAQ